jgi:hypothetical protein
MQVHLTLKSANVKTGPIPVSTTERASCPPDCNVRDACYAASGPLALHWAAVSNGTRGTDWATFTDTVAAMPDGQLWRHNQAGDLPVAGGTVDAVKLGQLVAANAGRRGFTYSHHRDAASIAWIRHANAWGFTVNLSANDLADADMLADMRRAPSSLCCPARKPKTPPRQRAALSSYAQPPSATTCRARHASYASASARPLSVFRPMARKSA